MTSDNVKAATTVPAHGKCLAAGSAMYFFGSILYYPCFQVIEFGEHFSIGGGVVGSWLYVGGSVLFFYSAVRDMQNLGNLASLISSEDAEDPTAESPMFLDSAEENAAAKSCLQSLGTTVPALLHVSASSMFLIGSLCFTPLRRFSHPTWGCYLFIIGCTVSLIASTCDGTILDASCHSVTKPIPEGTMVALVFHISGCVLFIYGSYFFLPNNLVSQNDITHAVNFFVVGSTAFLFSALATMRYSPNKNSSDLMLS